MNTAKYFTTIIIIILLSIFSGCKAKQPTLDEISQTELREAYYAGRSVKEAPKDLNKAKEEIKETIKLTPMEENIVPPKVLEAFPADLQMGVSPNIQIRVIFSKKLDIETIHPENVFLENSNGSIIAGKLQYRNAPGPKGAETPRVGMIEFTPNVHLQFSKKYFFIMKNIRDEEGNLIENDYKIGFTTVNVLDDKSPTVAGIAFNPPPLNGKIPVNSSILINFSEDMHPDSINDSSIWLQEMINGRPGNKVPSTITLLKNLVTLKPRGILLSGKSFIIVIDNTVEDANGNRMLIRVSQPFSTD